MWCRDIVKITGVREVWEVWFCDIDAVLVVRVFGF